MLWSQNLQWYQFPKESTQWMHRPTEFWWENFLENGTLEDWEVDGRITLRCILRMWIVNVCGGGGARELHSCEFWYCFLFIFYLIVLSVVQATTSNDETSVGYSVCGSRFEPGTSRRLVGFCIADGAVRVVISLMPGKVNNKHVLSSQFSKIKLEIFCIFYVYVTLWSPWIILYGPRPTS